MENEFAFDEENIDLEEFGMAPSSIQENFDFEEDDDEIEVNDEDDIELW